MANIVQQTQKTNHVNHSTFDLSGNINLSATTGMLLPVRVDDCLPNSRYTFNTNVFARTVQMVVPSFARVKAHLDTFFVPYRLLGTDYKDIIVANDRAIMSNYSLDTNNGFANNNASLPFIQLEDYFVPGSNSSPGSWDFGSLSDAAGISYNLTTPLLLNMLGYGVPAISSSNSTNVMSSGFNLNADGGIGSSSVSSISKVKRNILFLQAYQKVYQDYYRNQLWEKENRSSYFVPSQYDSHDFTSIAKTSGLLEMRYHDYDKDRIIGMVPNENNILSDGVAAYSSTILAGTAGFDSSSVLGPQQIPNGMQQVTASSLTGSSSSTKLSSLNLSDPQLVKGLIAKTSAPSSVAIQQYTALSNKRLEAMQRYAEITSLNKSDYKHQIKAHFGLSDEPELVFSTSEI